jgi:hypothetical protein
MPGLESRMGNMRKAHGVIAGLVPAISIRMARCELIGIAGTSPAMTKWELPRVLPLSPERVPVITSAGVAVN